MADNTLVNKEGLLTTSPSILADIANNPAEDSLLASDDEDIPFNVNRKAQKHKPSRKWGSAIAKKQKD